MPQKTFALTRGGPKELLVKWERNYRNLTITLGDQLVGTVSDASQLKRGATFTLPDSSRLDVSLERSRLNLSRNYLPLPETFKDPVNKISGAAGAAGAIAIFTLLVSFILPSTVFSSGNTRVDSATQGIQIVLAIVFMALALAIGFKQKWALWVALIIYGIDTVLIVIGGVSGAMGGAALGVHVAALWILYQGFDGFSQYEAEQAMLLKSSIQKQPSPSDQ
ncbi:MAG: hypothetical protein IAE83_04720 [Anaerolinea sp.]|nr:hypothetical protein [Anaerolinea sp.]MCC6973913.1 hypothetical protein [Anaerolineae bacterium]CAG1002406.1 hypothetical protein ANRL4_03259 [Anaerolineae bacterium]